MIVCQYCGDEIFIFNKAPSGFELSEYGEGWATDITGDIVEDFICFAREATDDCPDGMPHEPLELKTTLVKYTFAVDVKNPNDHDEVIQAVEEYVNSVGFAFDSPDSIEIAG